MSDGVIDPGLAVVIAMGLLALVYLGLAVVNFRRGRNGFGAARLFAAVLFGAVTYFFAVVQLKLF